jgi:predicted small lipoprotein YifL
VKIIVTFAALALISAALAGCAYKPLKAPCSPDEGGTPLAY